MDIPTVSIRCSECGVQFWPIEAVWKTRGMTGEPVFCPSGHKTMPPFPDEVSRARSAEASAKSSKEFWERRFDEERKTNQRMAKTIIGLRGCIAGLMKRVRKAEGK